MYNEKAVKFITAFFNEIIKMLKIVERVEPLVVMTLGKAKGQLNIVDFNDDDDYIESLVLVAGQMAEEYKKTLYSTCNVQGQMECGVISDRLPIGPFVSITSVINDENEIDYSYNAFSGRITLTPDNLNISEPTIVTYVAGYTKIPPMVLHACKIIISDLYENRESATEAKMTPTIFSALRLLL